MWDRIWARRRDLKTWLIIFAVAAVYITSAVLGWALQEILFINKDAVYLSFYASWVQDVLFFTIVGVAVAIYTAPFRSDVASFEERIGAFYGSRAPHPLRQFAKSQLTRYGGYLPYAHREVVIKDYDEERGAYRAEVHSKFQIHNLFEDVEYIDNPTLQLIPDSFDDPPSPFGEMEWITVGPEEKLLDGPVLIDPKEGFHEVVEIRIPRGEKINYEYRYWEWWKIGEKNSQNPQRVVLLFDMLIRNVMSNQIVKFRTEGEHPTEVALKPGQSYRFPTARNSTPEDVLFIFRLENALAVSHSDN